MEAKVKKAIKDIEAPNAAAALTIQGFGAVASLPRAADVHASGLL